LWLVEKDVLRTDRHIPMFSDSKGEGLKKLHNVLLTYAFYDKKTGYVQGMSDLISPIVFTVENEADAFWCFSGLMKAMKANFDYSQNGIHLHLTSLAHLIALVDFTLFRKIGKLFKIDLRNLHI
jgi:hypothetical protein